MAPRVVALAALLSFSACSGGAMIGSLPEKVGGLPASAPQRPAETMPYPNVYEPRPERPNKPLSEEEQKKLESDLSNLRDAQNKRAIPPPEPEPKAAAKKSDKSPAKNASKPPPKERPKKVAAKPKKAPEKKPDETLVPDQKGPSNLKLMN